jgi:hypothetical protein
MRTNKIVGIAAWTLIGISALGVGSVSLMAFMDPQAVMDLVGVKLENTDAYSSIRGVYGGVGVTLLVVMVGLALQDRRAAMRFLSLFWGMYAISRLMTIAMEGELGSFGNQWLVIELVLSASAFTLHTLMARKPAQRLAYAGQQ